MMIGIFMICEVCVYMVCGGGVDYYDQGVEYWIDDYIVIFMSVYFEYWQFWQSFGINVFGMFVVEIEVSDGIVGFLVMIVGEIGVFIVEKYFVCFFEGCVVIDIECIWDQMYKLMLYYGCCGVVFNVISGVDFVLYDLFGCICQVLVFELFGGLVCDELQFYVMGVCFDKVKEFGFIGGKMFLYYGFVEGEEGFWKNIEMFVEMCERVGDDFWFMYDCWMLFDVDYVMWFVYVVFDYGFKWFEEVLIFDDYWGYVELCKCVFLLMFIIMGEYEVMCWGFC